MTNLPLSVQISRDGLGLSSLEVNDGLIYKIAGSPFLGEAMSWDRKQVTSVYIDGSVTVSRSRQVVNEQVAIEVTGRDPASPTNPAVTQAHLQANMATLKDAFSQDSYTLDVTVGSGGDATHYTYQGEAADVQVAWVTGRFLHKQGQMTFTMPRQPVPLAGGV